MAQPAHIAGMTLALSFLFLEAARAFQMADAPVENKPAREQGPPAVAQDYDFRGSRPLPPGMRLAGALHNLTTRPEEAGFRLTIRGERPNPIGRAGIEMPTALRGDFEITAGYEIVHADAPTDGYGVGFEFFAHTVHKPQQGMGVYRMTRVDDGDVYFVSRNFINKDGKPDWDQKRVPTAAKSGRLRIVRRGTTATALAADGTGNFKELSRKELGPDDITVLWLMAYTGHAQYAVDLRVTELTIRAGVPIADAPPRRVDDVAAVGAEAPPESETKWLRRWWRFVAMGLILLLLGVAGVFAALRRRRADKHDGIPPGASA